MKKHHANGLLAIPRGSRCSPADGQGLKRAAIAGATLALLALAVFVGHGFLHLGEHAEGGHGKGSRGERCALCQVGSHLALQDVVVDVAGWDISDVQEPVVVVEPRTRDIAVRQPRGPPANS